MPRCAKGGLTIGIDGRELLPDCVTGVGRYLRNFLFSKAIRSSSHRFVVYGNQHSSLGGLDPRIRTRSIHEGRRLWWDQVVLPGLASRDRLDVFFSPYDKAPLGMGCPLVMTFHDLLFLIHPEQSRIRSTLYRPYYLSMRRPMARRARLVLTVSRHAKSDLVNVLRVAPAKVRVVYNGVGEGFEAGGSPGDDTEVLRHYGLDKSYFLYVGNFKPHKNLQVLLEAYSGMGSRFRERILLALAGSPDPHQAALREQVDRMHLGAHVRFTGTVNEAHLAALYRSATCLVHPSLYEGFGLTPLEAMACGTPVVASRATSLPEVVGDAGLLVDPTSADELRDAMIRMLTREDLRRSCALAGRRQARKFTAEAAALRILASLEDAARPQTDG